MHSVPGVGDQVDNTELNTLATQPSCTHVQLLKDYQDLDTLRSDIQQLSCKGSPPPPCSLTSPV